MKNTKTQNRGTRSPEAQARHAVISRRAKVIAARLKREAIEARNTKTQTAPTDLERMHYTDEAGRKRIATIKPGSIKMLLDFEVLTYTEYTRGGVPMNAAGIISVEMITKRVPLVQNLVYGNLEAAKN